MTDKTKTYNLDEVEITIGGVRITGFGEDDSIDLKPSEQHGERYTWESIPDSRSRIHPPCSYVLPPMPTIPAVNCRCVTLPAKRNPSIAELRRWWISIGRTNRSFKRTRIGAIRAEWRTGYRGKTHDLVQSLLDGMVSIKPAVDSLTEAFSEFGRAAEDAGRMFDDMLDSMDYAIRTGGVK